ncbi:hypothetical protein [Dokdonella sp.]|nr:hypothetical protein [Dokdonella sp.]HPN80632.1 hypothetical protein [Dokdonella sp.]
MLRLSQTDPSQALRRSMAVWLCALGLTACSPSPAPGLSPAPAGASPAVVDEPGAGRLAAVLVRGYFEARDGGLFTACGETSRRHVRSIDEITSTALARSAEARAGPLFVVAQGDLIGRDSVSIGAFDLITPDAWSCESKLDGFVAQARGNEVLWSLEVTPASVSFSPGPGSPTAISGYRAPISSAGSLLFDAGEGSKAIAIRLDPEPCDERMTGTIFGWSAKVTFKDQAFSGCAWRGTAGP